MLLLLLGGCLVDILIIHFLFMVVLAVIAAKDVIDQNIPNWWVYALTMLSIIASILFIKPQLPFLLIVFFGLFMAAAAFIFRVGYPDLFIYASVFYVFPFHFIFVFIGSILLHQLYTWVVRKKKAPLIPFIYVTTIIAYITLVLETNIYLITFTILQVI